MAAAHGFTPSDSSGHTAGEGHRLLDAGDAAFTVEFGDRIDPQLQARVLALDAAVNAAQAAGALPGLIETMPTFRSLTLFYDPLQTSRAELVPAVERLLQGAAGHSVAAVRRWRLPVCYEGEFAPDLAGCAQALGLSPEAVVAAHAGTEVGVYMLGFLPGFPFMGDLPEALRLPRRSEPRLRVAPGSVAIAGALTAIYPWQSPGGWHLIGRCPVPLFDARLASPARLAPGDRVAFEPVDRAQFERLQRAFEAGELDPDSLRLDPKVVA